MTIMVLRWLLRRLLPIAATAAWTMMNSNVASVVDLPKKGESSLESYYYCHIVCGRAQNTLYIWNDVFFLEWLLHTAGAFFSFFFCPEQTIFLLTFSFCFALFTSTLHFSHPLFKPCKCSGSIGLVHQDCLQSWLAVQRGGGGGGSLSANEVGGRCELCKTTFQFAPMYADNAPTSLPNHVVVVGMLQRVASRWIPFGLRLLFAIILWLVLAPLGTAYLYHAWMTHRGVYAIYDRLIWSLVPGDLVAGAVVAACIVISFLSLMSFADFLRVEFQNGPIPPLERVVLGQQQQQAVPPMRRPPPPLPPPPPRQPGNAAAMAGAAARQEADNNNAINNMARPVDRNQPPAVIPDEDVDDGIWNHVHQQQQRRVQQHRDQMQQRIAAAAVEASVRADPPVADADPPVIGDDGDGSIVYDDDFLMEEDDDDDEDVDVEDDDDDDDDDDDSDDDDDIIDEAAHALFREELLDELGDLQRQAADAEDADAANNVDNDDELPPLLPRRRNRNQRQRQPPMGQPPQPPPPRQPNNNFNNNNNNDMDPRGVGGQFGGGFMGMGDLDGDLNGGGMGGGGDPVDMDINIALDELLGVRGPLNAVIRNLLWLLVFNFVYLGLFAFTPKILGTALSSVLFNGTAFGFEQQQQQPGHENDSSNSENLEDQGLLIALSNGTSNPHLVAGWDQTNTTINNATSATTNHTGAAFIQDHGSLVGIIRAVEAESSRLNTTFRLKDIATIIVGYLSCAITMVVLRYLWMLSKKIRVLRHARLRRTANNDNNNNNADMDDIRDAMNEMNRLVHDRGHDFHRHRGVDEHQGIAIAYAVGVALDAVMAIVKVGILLFLKMFLLPVVLGICLDASTLTLFSSSLEERILHAGADLFSFLLLHWVAGITFMLLVTVSVLQLREVTHPDLLGQMIRPQEPQPDLLGNLMHESVSTHTKRMILSLIIYAFLLWVQVLLPVRMAIASGAAQSLPFLKLKFCYVVMPQLQVPVELLVFHLCMLGLLEKYKNSIGEMQHYWLKLQCRWMNMTHCILPQRIEAFRLVGSRPVFKNVDGEHKVDEFWYTVSKGERDTIRESIIDAQLDSFQPPVEPCLNGGDTKPNGQRVLRFGSGFIRLPFVDPAAAYGRSSSRSRSVLMPTTIGRFRLKRDLFNNNTTSDAVIQLWEEVPGTVIPRPPVGWDDLGLGGADVQGRWAWGGERKSSIEEGVARRSCFFFPGQGLASTLLSVAKLCSLLVFSWLATTLFICFAFASPLAIGRCLYYILRIPEPWIHDPLGFAAGCLVFFPLLRKIAGAVVAVDAPVWYRIAVWAGSFRPPPTRKMLILLVALVLWYGVAPFLLGCIYDVAFVKPLGDDDAALGSDTLILTWGTGIIFLDMWRNVCVSGFFPFRFWNFFFEERPVPGAADAGAAAGAQEPDPATEADEQAAAWVNAGGNRLRLPWQGKHGRVARFVEALGSILVGFEYDKVDATVLLHDCVVPLTITLFWTLFFPALCFGICLWHIQTFSGLARAVLVRSVLALVCMVEASRIWRDQLLSWFTAAHRLVRNDRYLIGRILLNYDEHAANASNS
jgi:RING-variant domain